jgi:pimeloyl-ACP methyl ester carboxylesterase
MNLKLASDFDGPAADGTAARRNSRESTRIILKGISHNLPQEAPQAFAQPVIDVDSY